MVNNQYSSNISKLKQVYEKYRLFLWFFKIRHCKQPMQLYIEFLSLLTKFMSESIMRFSNP